MPAAILIATRIDGLTPQLIQADQKGTLRVRDARELSYLKVTKAYNAAGVGPHAQTQRWTYTVPANRCAILESAMGVVYRDGAPGAVNRGGVSIYYTPSGGSQSRIIEIMHYNAAVGSMSQATWGGALWLFAGDVLLGYTNDTSTGGTMLYNVNAILTEYAAET